MIEYIVIGSLALVFASGILPILCTMLKVDDPYIPSREYADDFAAHLSGKESPGSAPSLAGEQPADPGDDIIDFRKLGTGPRGILQTKPHHANHRQPWPVGCRDRPATAPE